MNRLTARPFGLLLLVGGLLTLGVPLLPAVGTGEPSTAAPFLQLLTDSPLLAAVFAVVGATAAVSGGARLRGTSLSPRGSLAVPGVSALGAALAISLLADVEPVAFLSGEFTDPHLLPLFAAVAGGGIAPIVLGTIREDAPVLIVGTVLLLAAAAVSSSPVLVLVVGLAGGSLAVAGLATVDRSTWRP